MKTIGYKAMHKKMTCRDCQFEVGKTYTIESDKPLRVCSDTGFHFCLNLEDVFNYYYYKDCRIFEIEAYGEVVTDYDNSIARSIKINREITKEELSNYPFNNIYHKCHFNNLTDDELLEYKNSSSYEIRLQVLINMKDKKLMLDTFKNDESWIVRKEVVRRMTDLDMMFNAFKDDEDEEVRREVVVRMKDLSLMFSTFKNDEDYKVRQNVVEKMEDLDLMFETFKDDEYWAIRNYVAKAMTNLELMYQTFKDDEDWTVRGTAERRWRNR